MSQDQRLEATDRVTLLMSMVPYFIARSPTTVAEVAKHFQIKENQVRELVSMLASSGIPGETGTYQHEDLFDINWDAFLDEGVIELWKHVGIEASPKFSAREAATLVAGLQFISGLVAGEDRVGVDKLIKKIAAGSSANPENIYIDAVEPPVDVDIIERAVSQNRSLEFTYRSAQGQVEERVVDPQRLDLVGQSWYLRAWCLDRKSLRTFRLDRIRNIIISSKEAQVKAGTVEISEDLYNVSDSDIIAECAIDERVLPFLSDYQAVVVGKINETDVKVELRFAHVNNVIRLVALYPGLVTVIGPDDVRQAIYEWSNQATF